MEHNSDIPIMLQAVEEELQNQTERISSFDVMDFHGILTYQMGWTGENCGSETRGKRIRPLLVLLTASACGLNWHHAVPAAAAVELIHNFSLVHDDIEDNSDLRRGRNTVWKTWGIAQGINAGDALFVLSNLSILDLFKYFPPEMVLNCATILHQTCLQLTIGQYMDMSFETQTDPSIEDYWKMISGKTAALLSASCLLGSTLSEESELKNKAYKDFGHYLGLAFQVQDDLLGIWGDSAITGKSNKSDLIFRKKTLPVLLGLLHSEEFSRRWKEDNITTEEVPYLADLLAKSGSYQFTQEAADKLTDMALQSLRTAEPQGEAGEDLYKLVSLLLNRDS